MSPTLLSVCRERAALRRYSPRTMRAYERWIIAFVRYHGRRHPRDLPIGAVRDFLTHLAAERGVAASTQNQALAALQFLYRDVLEMPLGVVEGVTPARRPHHLPNVLSRTEVQRVLSAMTGTTGLMARLLYGSGLRLLECCQLRLKDVHLELGELVVRRGKGNRDRVTMLPLALHDAMSDQMAHAQRLLRQRIAAGGGYVELPGALDRKVEVAGRQPAWIWIFPASREYLHAPTGQRRTHHLHPTVLQRAVADAARRAGITVRVGCHTFRHSFATHLPRRRHAHGLSDTRRARRDVELYSDICSLTRTRNDGRAGRTRCRVSTCGFRDLAAGSD